MKKLLLFSLIAGLFAVAQPTDASACWGKKKKKKVTIEAKSGSTLSGTATFSEKKGIVTMVVNVAGVSPGLHAIHIHQKGDCSAADAASAGGHWNPTEMKHGKWGEHDGHHAGDIGNLSVDANGKGKLTFSTDKWCLSCTDTEKSLIGRSLIIHADVDDFKTQPTGNAGGRIGCAVIN